MKIDSNEFLWAVNKMQTMIAETQEILMRSAYMIRNNVDMCYSVDLPGHEPYTNSLLAIMQQCENNAKELGNFMQYVEEYRKYLDIVATPVLTPPTLNSSIQDL